MRGHDLYLLEGPTVAQSGLSVGLILLKSYDVLNCRRIVALLVYLFFLGVFNRYLCPNGVDIHQVSSGLDGLGRSGRHFYLGSDSRPVPKR